MERELLRQKTMDDFCAKRVEFWRQWTNLQLTASDHHKRVLEFFSHQSSYLLKLEGIIHHQAAELEREEMKLRSALKAVAVFLKRDESHQEAMKAVIQALEAANEKNVCQICMSNPRNVVIMPCMHLLYCVECLRIHLGTSSKCPMCRGTIKTWIPCVYNLD